MLICRQTSQKPLSPLNEERSPNHRAENLRQSCPYYGSKKKDHHVQSQRKRHKTSQFFENTSQQCLLNGQTPSWSSGEALGQRTKDAAHPCAEVTDPWARLKMLSNPQKSSPADSPIFDCKIQRACSSDAQLDGPLIDLTCETQPGRTDDSSVAIGHFYGLEHLGKFGKEAANVVDKAAARHGLQKPPSEGIRSALQHQTSISIHCKS